MWIHGLRKMTKQTFVCPNCNNSSTFNIESTIYRYSSSTNINFQHNIIRCDVCDELTYKITQTERIYKNNLPTELKAEETFRFPFGYLNIEQDLPESIKNFYMEAYNCYQIGALRGSAAMCRATISAICDNKGASGQDLKVRINNLPLTQRLKDVAKNIKWIGDKTLHNEIDWSQAKWNKGTIEEALGFIGRIVDDLYTQERKAKELNKVISKLGSKGL